MNPILNSNYEKLINLLPEDFESLEGKCINGWRVKTRDEIYSISSKRGEFFVLAQKDEMYLCLSIEYKKQKLFYFSDHESEAKFLKSSFGRSLMDY
jgi:hypothetical protein